MLETMRNAQFRVAEVKAARRSLGEDGLLGRDALVKYVYLLESISDPTQSYIGLADDLRERLKKHNSGGSPHTSKYLPWRVVSYFAFSREKAAVDFERYLKTASGRAFAKKRLT